MNELIYIVIGRTGEYSDQVEWIEGAYRNEENAKNRVIELDNLMRLYGYCSLEDNSMEYEEREKLIKLMKENPNGDSEFCFDYTGTRYHYVSVCVKD
jgi:hypothetical protein